MEIKYKFYATLLDKFQSYISSAAIYQQFWGFADNPEKTEQQFEEEQFQGLIDTINRVPFESERADKGTAFNEVVDCLIENRKSDKVIVEKVYKQRVSGDVSGNSDERWAEVEETNIVTGLKAHYNNRAFTFNIDLCQEFAGYFKGALTQQSVSGVVRTRYGEVQVYGNLDILMPFKVADIKTTAKYYAGKYRNNWQHIVYPFCLNQNGVPIHEFEYAITDFKNTWTEWYVFKPERDYPRLVEHCELLIEFLEQNRDLVTDKKIFAAN
jgi:hypothetical protein